jgi:hypothetical protein
LLFIAAGSLYTSAGRGVVTALNRAVTASHHEPVYYLLHELQIRYWAGVAGRQRRSQMRRRRRRRPRMAFITSMHAAPPYEDNEENVGKREARLGMLQCFQNVDNTCPTYRSLLLGRAMLPLDDGKQ